MWMCFYSIAASKVKRAGTITGKLLIKSKVVAYKLTVPFTVDFYHGNIKYSDNITNFYTGPTKQQGDILKLSNFFY